MTFKNFREDLGAFLSLIGTQMKWYGDGAGDGNDTEDGNVRKGVVKGLY